MHKCHLNECLTRQISVMIQCLPIFNFTILSTGLIGLVEKLSTKYELQFIQSKTGSDKVGFSHLDEQSSEKVAKTLTELLPTLCNHLESTSAFFQVSQL